jgi:hypothetical protein
MKIKKIFRFDDVCINADMDLINNMTNFLVDRFPNCVVLWGVSPLVHDMSEEKNEVTKQRIFPKILNAHSDYRRYYDVDLAGLPDFNTKATLAAHGLVHVDHRLLPKPAQEMSILISASLVKSKIFIQFTGFGNVAVGVVWGTMLIYDLYKVFSGGEWSWMDILFDVLGMISGGAVKALQIAMKSIGITKSMPMAAGIQKLAANPATKGFMSKILSGLSKVWESIKSVGSWLYKWTGFKWIFGVVGKAEAFLSENILKPIGNGLGLRSVVGWENTW